MSCWVEVAGQTCWRDDVSQLAWHRLCVLLEKLQEMSGGEGGLGLFALAAVPGPMLE